MKLIQDTQESKLTEESIMDNLERILEDPTYYPEMTVNVSTEIVKPLTKKEIQQLEIEDPMSELQAMEGVSEMTMEELDFIDRHMELDTATLIDDTNDNN